jgi:hypothetical protein
MPENNQVQLSNHQTLISEQGQQCTKRKEYPGNQEDNYVYSSDGRAFKRHVSINISLSNVTAPINIMSNTTNHQQNAEVKTNITNDFEVDESLFDRFLNSQNSK